MPGSLTTPGRSGTRVNALARVAFRHGYGVGARDQILSRLNGWPMQSPTDASPPPSRTTTHGSGPMWIATPSSQRTSTVYSLPVSRRTPTENKAEKVQFRYRSLQRFTIRQPFSARSALFGIGGFVPPQPPSPNASTYRNRPSQGVNRPHQRGLIAPPFSRSVAVVGEGGIGDGQVGEVERGQRDAAKLLRLEADEARDPGVGSVGTNALHPHRLAEQRAGEDLSFMDGSVAT